MNTKKICRDGRHKERKDLLFRRPPVSSLAIFVFCLSLFFLSSCKTETQQADKNTPAAKTETVSNSPNSNPPKVTQVDAAGLKNLLKPNGRPLLINFWATWCDPCREEFPDLVKIGADYKGKIDLITVSLDEPSEINGSVPKFLAQMKSDSPAYLLTTADEGAAIEMVSKDWQGALPFTILYNAQGETVYSKQGKFKTDVLATEIEKNLAAQTRMTSPQITESTIHRVSNWDLIYGK